MVLKARITFRHESCYSQTLAGVSTAAQITRDADRDVYIMHGSSPEEVDTYIRHMVPVFGASLEILDRTPRSVLYRGSNPPHATVAAVLASGCSVLWPVVFGNDRQLLTIVAPDRKRLEALVHDLSRLGMATVDQVTELPPEALTTNVALADFVGGLTERQVSVLWYAIEHGYYDSPRRISTEEIAAHFGIGRSTADEHLRKAERGVLQRVSSIFASFHAMLPRATKKRGRPRTWRERKRAAALTRRRHATDFAPKASRIFAGVAPSRTLTCRTVTKRSAGRAASAPPAARCSAGTATPVTR